MVEFQRRLTSLKESAVTVLGAARSGLAAAELLHEWGASVFVSDNNPEALTPERQQRLESLGIPFESGAHSDRVYQANLVVISPGIPDHAPVVRELERREIPIISEIELSAWFADEPIIAVTGSNGKTTTSTLIAELLDFDQKHPVLCGNIGRPFAQAVGRGTETAKKKAYLSWR